MSSTRTPLASTGALLSNILGAIPTRGSSCRRSSSGFEQLLLARLGVKGISPTPKPEISSCALFRSSPVAVSGCLEPFCPAYVDRSFRTDRRLKSDSVPISAARTEVLDSLLENLSNKEIASKLNIAERTVSSTFQICSTIPAFARRADLILLLPASHGSRRLSSGRNPTPTRSSVSPKLRFTPVCSSLTLFP